MSATVPENYISGNASRVLPPDDRAVAHVLNFLQWRFSRHARGSYYWDPSSDVNEGQTTSEILITSVTPVSHAIVGERPAITLQTAGINFSGGGIGDLAYVDLDTGAKVRMDFMPTQLRINVLSRVAFEAKSLAWYITEQIWAFRDAIVKLEPALLSLGQRPVVSPPLPPGSLMRPTPNDEWVVVVIQFPMVLQHSVTTLPLNQRILRHVQIKTDLPQGGAPEAQSGGS